MPGRRRGLIRLGTLSRRLESGTLVLAVDRIPPLGQSVYDSELEEVGSVASILGPVARPMVEVRTRTRKDQPKEAVFYLLE